MLSKRKVRFLAELRWPNGEQRCACLMEGHGFGSQASTNAFGHVCKYVDLKDSAGMLTFMQSVGVTPEVTLRSTEATKYTRTLKPRVDITKSPKQGYEWPQYQCLPKFFKKKEEISFSKHFVFVFVMTAFLSLSRERIRMENPATCADMVILI